MERRQFLKLSLTALAGTALSIQQIDWLLAETEKPQNIDSTDFRKYIVSELNKLPEKKFGRCVKTESLIDPSNFKPLIRGLNVSKYNKKAKYWNFTFDPEKIRTLSERKSLVKRIVKQLEIAFK